MEVPLRIYYLSKVKRLNPLSYTVFAGKAVGSDRHVRSQRPYNVFDDGLSSGVIAPSVHLRVLTSSLQFRTNRPLS